MPGRLKAEAKAMVGLMREAAEEGHASAQSEIGAFYGVGAYGLKQDQAEALVWYRRSAA